MIDPDGCCHCGVSDDDLWSRLADLLPKLDPRLHLAPQDESGMWRFDDGGD
jgi:hypothetical protein